MNTVAVIGTQWGDEGKGKIVDLLARHADVVVRFQGGNNAAHTLVVDGAKFILRLVPAGALYPGKVCVIGAGMAVDPIALLEELAELKRAANFAPDGRLKLSYDAHMVMPYHRAIDRAREARLGKDAIGTTGFGIGPAYEDKAARCGLRFSELADFPSFERKLRRNLAEKNRYLTAVLKAKPVPVAGLVERMRDVRRKLLPHLCDTAAYLAEALERGQRILFEGAHGTMLDIDYGTYPFVTSSSCVASAVFAGGGLPGGRLDAVMGIAKAYTTRVGAGPFPTEIKTRLGDHLREKGAEYGSATQRPRRVGWFDAVLTRRAMRVNGAAILAVTKLDVLTGIDPVRICVAYEYRGARSAEIPASPARLERVKPVYEEMAGWHERLSEKRELGELPPNARRYLERISELCSARLAMVGVGASREEIIVLEDPFLNRR
jgi:adenylosuccinate synthase